MNTQPTFKTYLGIFFQMLAAMLAFVVSLILGNMLSPLSPAITEAGKTASGFVPTDLAFLFNAFANALILVWAARRSSFKGLALTGQLFVLSFGAQVLMTQIETGYFLNAFPLLTNNLQLYNLTLRGFLTSLIFSLPVTLIAGGFSNKPRPKAAFTVPCNHAVKQGFWLPVVYIILYALAGYFIAWQVKELRLLLRWPTELNGFFEQWGHTLMQKPEIPVFQYARGVLWMLCLVPLFKGFTGKRPELVLLSGLAFALLPTAQLAPCQPAHARRRQPRPLLGSCHLNWDLWCAMCLVRAADARNSE